MDGETWVWYGDNVAMAAAFNPDSDADMLEDLTSFNAIDDILDTPDGDEPTED